MKSLQVIAVMPPHERANFSDLQVMRSGGGWYVGTKYTNPQGGFVEPGSRDTDYFTEEKHAQLALAILERLDEIPLVDDEEGLACFEAVLGLLGLNPRGVGYRLEP